MTTAHHDLEVVTFTRPRCQVNPETHLPHTVDVELTRLNVIHDYNCFMDGVDVADQLRGYYSCSLKCMKWWHAIFYWIVDTAATNAYLLHKEGMKAQAASPMTHLEFMADLAESLLSTPHGKERSSSSSGAKRRRSADAAMDKPESRLIGSHMIRAIQGSSAKNPQRDCVRCKANGKRSRTNYECGTCNVGLHSDCFEEWHK
ncbi:piggyBac transposable element-derived protein 3-like [Sycon ciliatum]